MTWTLAQLQSHDDAPVGDQVVHLNGTFDLYEALLRERGEKAVPRISYLEGHIVIVSPSIHHEKLKSLIGRLVETYCMWANVPFTPAGSWTLKDPSVERGAEPDECYVLGRAEAPARPHLAIEVVWTSAGIDKLEIYRGLGVGEVWIWRKGRITIHILEQGQYREVASSRALPGIDLEELARFLDRPTAFDAMRDYRALLEQGPRAPGSSR